MSAADELSARDGLLARDGRVLWHPYTQHGADPPTLAVESARGSVLKLADGREVIDAVSSWWSCLHGHGVEELADAIAAQTRELDHVMFAGITHEPAVALSEELLAVAPDGLTRAFYSDNGSTAVEVALKMAYQAWVHRGEPRRRLFVALEGAYHGDTFGAMSVGERDPFFTAFAPLLFEAVRVPADAEALRAALDEHGDAVAGVVLEPLVQGAAGMRMHGEEFVRAARAECTERGLYLVADEVMTGFGRTGSLFACRRAGVRPDLLCLAKGLTAGMLPLAVTLATEDLFECFLSEDRARTFFHGHTFTANPIGCALARASLARTLRTDVPATLDRLGARIEAGVRERLEDRAAELGLRRTGGIVAYDLAGESGYLAASVPRLRAAAVERGVLLRPLGNVVYAMPPASTTDAQADRVAEAMAELATLV